MNNNYKFFQDKIIKRIYIVYLGVFIYTWLLLSPGVLNYDVYVQLKQMIQWQFDDWHPTAFILLWSILYPLFGMKSMLFVQLFAWFGSFALFTHIIYLRCNLRHRWYLLFLPSLLLFTPYSLFTIGSVVKDFQMFYVMLLVFSILVFLYFVELKSNLRRLFLLFAFLCLIYVVNVRHFGFIIAWPLMVLWLYILNRVEKIVCLRKLEEGRKIWKIWFLRSVVSFGLTLFLFFGYHNIVDRFLLKTKFVIASPYITMMDIAGTYYHSVGMDALPLELFRDPEHKQEAVKKLDSVYKRYPLNGDHLGNLGLWRIPDNLYSIWFNSIKAHPLGYLKHRLRFSTDLLFFKDYIGAMISNDDFAAHYFLHNFLREALESSYSWAKTDINADPNDTTAAANRIKEFYRVLDFEIERYWNSTLASFRYPFRAQISTLHVYQQKLMYKYYIYTPIVLGLVYLFFLIYALIRRYILTFFLCLQALLILFFTCMTVSVVTDMRYWSFIYIASSALLLTWFLERYTCMKRQLKNSNT